MSQRLSIDIPEDQPRPTPPSPPAPESVSVELPSNTIPGTPADTKTGRKMRDCRKFIHYDFSPPFVSSESSQSEVDVSEDGDDTGPKKIAKKRGRPRKNFSMEDKDREESPVKEFKEKKPRGRKPVKSQSTDSAFLTDDRDNSPVKDSEIKVKKKRGRPPKVRPPVEPQISVSDMAEELAESHVKSRSSIISLQRQTLLSRRCSEGSEPAPEAPRAAALKRVERSHSFDTVEGVDELTKKLMASHPQLLLKAPLSKVEPDASQSETSIKSAPLESIEESLTEQPVCSDNSLPQQTCDIRQQERPTTTVVVRKKVTVQRYSEPLMDIVDQLPKKSSPPPSTLEDPDRPMTPPPGTATIYQENLDLLDGMKVLTRIGPHFYPGKVTAVEGSSIFAVSIEGERGNKPHIYPAEELLQKTLLDVSPGSRRYTPVGARVCVLWSSKLNFLYPGTVKSFTSAKQFILVELDDGDQREIHIDNVRLLPRAYPKVVGKSKRERPLGEVDDDNMIRFPISAISPEGKKRMPGKPGKLQEQRKFHESMQQKTEEDPVKPKPEVKDATLNADLLKDGLRILNKKNGHFYPGRLNAVRPPDIYGILLDNERGFRPSIFAREELLLDAIREIKVKSADLPMGTRVCAYWSAKYHFLHPGTVLPVSLTLTSSSEQSSFVVF